MSWRGEFAMRTKLCYNLIIYDEETESHFYHVYEMLEKLGEKIDIYLVIEKAKQRPKFKNVKKIYIQKFKFPPLRILENLLVMLSIRLKGYKKFYTRYSSHAGINMSLITKVLGGEVYFWDCGMPDRFTRKEKILVKPLFLANLRLVDYLVTGTKSVAEYYSNRFKIDKKKIKIVPNWVNLNRFNPQKYQKERLKEELGIEKNRYVVLFVHRLSWSRGTDYIPEIVREVLYKCPEAIFLVIGDGPDRRKLEEEIRRNKLRDFIKIMGNIPNKEIPKYYSLADVFIMPSNVEGFPRVLLEAMAMGVPFVATDVGGVIDIVTEKQKEFIVPRGDMEQFANNVVTLINDENKRDDLTREGLVQVKKYEKEEVAKGFIEIFQ